MYIYQYARYHQSYQIEHETLESAIDDAFTNHAFGTAYPKQIIDKNDKVIMDHEALLEEFIKR